MVDCSGLWWIVVDCSGLQWMAVDCSGLWWIVVNCGGLWLIFQSKYHYSRIMISLKIVDVLWNCGTWIMDCGIESLIVVCGAVRMCRSAVYSFCFIVKAH